jgi:hypothetical protein
MFVLICPKSEFYAQLYDFSGTNCHFNTGFSASVSAVSLSVAFLRNQLTTDIEGLVYVLRQVANHETNWF